VSKRKNCTHLYVALVLLCIASSCNRTTNAAAESAAMGQLMSAEELLAANDCAACHHQKESIIGPSYVQIAERYTTKDISMLTEKIIKGGKGNWGETPMTAHPGLSQAEATEMVNYILSVNESQP
jgi:cytochrome c